MTPPRFPRPDSNQKHIRQNLERLGFSVQVTSNVGDDFPDLVIGKYGVNLLIELKTFTGKLSKGQAKFHDTWQGASGVARTTSEVVALFNNYAMSLLTLRVDVGQVRGDMERTLTEAIEMEKAK